MKPTNTKPSLLLEDNAPVRCMFYAFGEGGKMDYCETDSTERASADHVQGLLRWLQMHPKAIIGFCPVSVRGGLYLCDTHMQTVRECQA